MSAKKKSKKKNGSQSGKTEIKTRHKPVLAILPKTVKISRKR